MRARGLCRKTTPLVSTIRYLSQDLGGHSTFRHSPHGGQPRRFSREVPLHADPSYPHVHSPAAFARTTPGVTEAGLQPLVVLEPRAGGAVPPHRTRRLRGSRS